MPTSTEPLFDCGTKVNVATRDVVVACPDARPPAYQAVIGLDRVGRLDRFVTGFYHRGKRPSQGHWLSGLDRKLARRNHPEIPSDRVVSRPFFDVCLAAENRVSGSLRNSIARLRTDRFDRSVLADLQQKSTRTLLAFSDVASEHTLPFCRKNEIRTVLSMVHGEVREEIEILEAGPNICGGMAGPARGLPNDWTTALLEAPLGARFARVRIENDCVAALEAERQWGALRGFDHCAYVTWSTGIGVGLCVDGHVLRGKNGNAGHAGHMFVSDNDAALCGCGNMGDVEGIVAGNSIARRFGMEAPVLFQAARAGDAAALKIVDELCRVMGRTLYNLVAVLDLQRISMGGSVFWHNREFLLPRLQAHIDGHLPALTAGALLVPAGLADKVGDYAAVALA